MVHLHKHSNGTFFLFSNDGYYTVKKEQNNLTAKVTFSDKTNYILVVGPSQMKRCLAVKPTLNKNIFMFMQSDSITPISFDGGKI